MTDRGGHWPGRRVLVLGCTGFLGTWAVRGLLARGAEVVGLVREANRPSDFFRDKLYRHVHVARGRADDLPRLRGLLAAYEIQTVFQLAAEPAGVADPITRTALAAAGPVPLVVPVPPGVSVRLRPAGESAPGVDVSLVRLPALFGGGDRRWDRWPPRLLLAAARGETLPVPPTEFAAVPVGYVRDVVGGMLDVVAAAAEPAATRPGVKELAVPPQGTGADLFAAAARHAAPGLRLHPSPTSPPSPPLPSVGLPPLAAAVAEAVEWYRTSVPPTESIGAPPAPRAAA